jgi:hypothetical protein
VGKSYVLTFSADILTYVPNATTVRFEADWDNAPLLAILNPATAHQGWVNYSFVVVGTGTDTLTFSGRNDPSYSGLDNVSLNAAVSQTLGADTPLPGNLTMCSVAAVVGLCVYGYRRRIQTAG